jgi:hypothetical protein
MDVVGILFLAAAAGATTFVGDVHAAANLPVNNQNFHPDPEALLQGRRRPQRAATEGPRALQALLEAAGRDDSVRGPPGGGAAPQTAAARAAAAKR